MHLSPDSIIFWQSGFIKINATMVFTWGIMLVLVLGARLITNNFRKTSHRTRGHNLLETLVVMIMKQIADVGLKSPERYLSFLGTLFIFLAAAAFCTILPIYEPPTGSLSTTAALAVSVFFAVPFFGIREQGLKKYLKSYTQPSIIMCPFHIISEITRTLALAVRLFGNMMSGTLILGILIIITPFVFPIAMTVLGLLTGMVQAYIFTILATVYIAAATQSHNL